jgi:hypothetical protein
MWKSWTNFWDDSATPSGIKREWYVWTVNRTSDYTHWALYRSYFKGISANIERNRLIIKRGLNLVLV